jgi:hypothetical protein
MSDGMSATETQTSAVAASANSLSFWRAAWARWKKIARAIGVVQTRILMVCLYFLFVLPVGIVMRLRGDPLRLKRPAGSNWTPHRDAEASVEAAGRQF